MKTNPLIGYLSLFVLAGIGSILSACSTSSSHVASSSGASVSSASIANDYEIEPDNYESGYGPAGDPGRKGRRW